jgi:serine protease Do
MLLDLPGLPAEVVGQDELTDTALLKLTTLPDRPLSEVKFGDSDQLAPGDWVMAIGNPFSLSNTVTVGVVSASGREQALAAPGRFEALIQTDAAINRGNSGGPLLNVRGEVVGINTMIVSNQTGGNLGIGFAVPINTVRDILPSLREGKVVRGRIAVSVERQPMTPELAEDFGLPSASGVIVSTVADGPAKDAGIRVGDVITKFNGEPVRTSNELVDRVMRTKPGTAVPVEIYRSGKPMTVQVTVAELDLEAEQTAVAGVPGPGRPDRPAPIETGFGMEIEELTPGIARQLRVPAGRGGAVVTRIDQRGAAAQRLAQGDVILSVNSRDTATLDEVAEALEAIPSGRTARLIVWRQGREVLVLVAKR